MPLVADQRQPTWVGFEKCVSQPQTTDPSRLVPVGMD